MKKTYSLRWQLTAVCTVLVVVPVVATGIISVRSSERELNAIIEERLTAQVALTAKNIATEADANKKRIEAALRVAHDVFCAAGSVTVDSGEQLGVQAVNQITKEILPVQVPAMNIGGEKIAGTYGIVDKIQKLVGGTVTIFQMMPAGALRISTNVLNDDGTRAVNTFIPTDSPVYATVMKGGTFYGRAYVVNAWYQTAYEPIVDGAGTVIGMLYVGIKDTSAAVLDGLAQAVIGKTGSVSVLNEKGDYMLSPNRERDGQNVMAEKDADGRAYMRDIIEKGMWLTPGTAEIAYYRWKHSPDARARLKIAAYSYIPEWDWVLVASCHADDFYGGVWAIKMATLAVGVLAIVLGALVAFFFARMVGRPVTRMLDVITRVSRGDVGSGAGIVSRVTEINRMSAGVDAMVENFRATASLAGKIAQGDLTVRVVPLSEQDALGHALKDMVEKLACMICDISASAYTISSGAGQMSSTSQALSQGASEQAGSLEEISSSMNEITAQVRQNAEHATQANTLAQEARSAAQKGNDRVSDMVSAMQGINDASRNISRIIKVIDEIAFQTNLLALNAAVEAARAGRYGKGFAVVAEEVRSLAARSAQAAKETSDMIEDAVCRIKGGTSMAGKTAEALGEIVAAAQQVNDLVGEIAAASSEQSRGVVQISQGLAQIDHVTQQNTAHAEESASAAEELSSQSMVLQQYVGMFRVTEGQKSLYRHAGGAEPAPADGAEDAVLPRGSAVKNPALRGMSPGGGNGHDRPDPVLQQAGILQHVVNVRMADIDSGNGNGGNGHDACEGQTGWSGSSGSRQPGEPSQVIDLDDGEFGKY